jgi:anaerobic selenocysteine-containing dehydrogenase
VREVLDESLAKGWQHVWPKPGNDPRVMFCLVSNPLRRIRSYPLLLEHLWPKLRTIVTIDWRMTSTACTLTTCCLPRAGTSAPSTGDAARPFIHGGEKAASFFEAKSDWEIAALLARTVDERAVKRGITDFKDRTGRERSFAGLWKTFSSDGEFGPTDDEKVAKELIDNASNLEGVSWEQVKKRGWARFTGVGKASCRSERDADHRRRHDHAASRPRHRQEALPTPFAADAVLSRPGALPQMGEQLPVHKDPPTAEAATPLQLTGGHTRWSIHGLARRQADAAPTARRARCTSEPKDAEARTVHDGMRVRVWNDSRRSR